MTAGQPGQELLRLEGIGVRLGGREILRDVSFTVRAGEFTGLIGPNGAGKTTLLKVILGLQAPTSGRVLLGGRPRPRRGRAALSLGPVLLSGTTAYRERGVASPVRPASPNPR